MRRRAGGKTFLSCFRSLPGLDCLDVGEVGLPFVGDCLGEGAKVTWFRGVSAVWYDLPFSTSLAAVVVVAANAEVSPLPSCVLSDSSSTSSMSVRATTLAAAGITFECRVS